MRTQDFDFFLPAHLIAQHPTPERNASRLLKLNGLTGELADTQFNQLVSFFQPNDLLIFNDTKVIKARLFGEKSSGGKVEVLIERVLESDLTQQVLAHIRASRSPKIGSKLYLEKAFEVTVIGRDDDLFLLEINSQENIYSLLTQHGHLPLPPYISHVADEDDEARYRDWLCKYDRRIDELLARLSSRRYRSGLPSNCSKSAGSRSSEPSRRKDLC